MNARLPDAVVVGAGVVGLTTGVCLAEAGLRVRIRTAALPAQTTSAVAGALIGPVFTAPGHSPSNVVTAWERTGISEFTRLAADPRTGVHLGRGRLAARPAAVEGGRRRWRRRRRFGPVGPVSCRTDFASASGRACRWWT